jgi:hypothetical protein
MTIVRKLSKYVPLTREQFAGASSSASTTRRSTR